MARVVDYETGYENAELAHDWMTWLTRALNRINEHHAKKILLYMTRIADEKVTPKILKKKLALELSEQEIHRKLEMLREAELIRAARTEYHYYALKGGTFYLLLKQHFKGQLAELDPEAALGIVEEVARLTAARDSLQGKLNNLAGRFAEIQLEVDMRTRKKFKPSVYFQGITDDREFEVARIYPRYVVQAPDGVSGEIDLRVDSHDGRTLIIEVKKHNKPVNRSIVKVLAERATVFAVENPDRGVLPALLATGGFSPEALTACRGAQIATATSINYVHKVWPA